MKFGFSLPNIGPIGTIEAVTKVAQRAEALGYSSLWTIERLLYPVKLQRLYPGTPDGHLPEIYKHSLDPLDALTYVAAQTKKIRLGTSVLDMPYYSPVVLARQPDHHRCPFQRSVVRRLGPWLEQRRDGCNRRRHDETRRSRG
jgi:Luciferase-like monooxygenase